MFTNEAIVRIDGVGTKVEAVGEGSGLNAATLSHTIARTHIMSRVARLGDGNDVLLGYSRSGGTTVLLHTEHGIVGPFAGIAFTPDGITVVAEVTHRGSHKKKAS